MKRIGSITINIAIAVGLLATGIAHQARAADGCTKATLKGSYDRPVDRTNSG
jgi:hypothetical protein